MSMKNLSKGKDKPSRCMDARVLPYPGNGPWKNHHSGGSGGDEKATARVAASGSLVTLNAVLTRMAIFPWPRKISTHPGNPAVARLFFRQSGRLAATARPVILRAQLLRACPFREEISLYQTH
jgi:hypothetical protein